MTLLILEGNTLGHRHRHYNKLLKDAIAITPKPAKINFDDYDVSNLMKIDIACNNRDVEYIMEVLKCEDMLYVSRTIKRSTWLITDEQYAHIINPKYLRTELLPQMTGKAVEKFMLHVRLNLKEETRAEAFYSWIVKTNIKAALKWLPLCPVSFIEQEVQHHASDISLELLKRLCRKSVNILNLFLTKYNYHKTEPLHATMFLLKSNTKEYLDLIESLPNNECPQLGVKKTQFLMKRCPERIIQNFQNYAHAIDLPTFAKQINKNDMKVLLLEHAARDLWWPTFENLKYFFIGMPKEDIIEFLKTMFNYKNDDGCDDDSNNDIKRSKMYVLFYAIERYTHIPSNIYRWYQFAPFNVAFYDIKRLIYAESSPDERNKMLVVLLNSAGRNMEQVQFVLQYYHDKHINEPFKYKKQFVNHVLSQTDTHSFDEKTWNILNELFHSMEVYIESKNNVQLCVKSIIIYQVLHGNLVSEIIENKFYFNTLKKFQNKLNNQDKEMIFQYLYNYLIRNLRKHNMRNELCEAMKLIENIWTLVKDWNKEKTYYSFVVKEIQEFINIERKSSRDISGLCSLYKMMKGWKRYMFKQSLELCHCEDVYINALKHGPELLMRYTSEVEAICSDDTLSLRRFLSKLRIYWPESIAREWSTVYVGHLKSISGHKAVVRGLYALLPRKELLDFIKMYTPTDTKIHWGENDEIELSLRRHIAKSMHLARPQLSTDVVLWYAKGDYLQYTLLSFNAIFYNLKFINIRNHINTLLSAPVSLQKHGIRLAFDRLKTEELLPICADSWKFTKNSTIRTVLFTSTFDLLCKEKKPTLINEIWKLLSTLIDDLTQEENKNIYFKLGEVKNVPLTVISKFYAKSYVILKSLPSERSYRNDLLDGVLSYGPDVMEYLDSDFVENILLESVHEIFSQKEGNYLHIIAAYLLCAKDDESQIQRYNRVLGPVITDSILNFKDSFQDLFRYLCNDLIEYVSDKDVIIPVVMLTKLKNALDKDLSGQKELGYAMLTNWKLAVAYIEVLDDLNENFDYSWEEIYKHAASLFGDICIQYLKNDIDMHFSSIYLLFADALQKLFKDFRYNDMVQLEILKSMLKRKDVLQGYLLVMKILPQHYYKDDLKAKRQEICNIIHSHPSSEIKMHYLQNITNNANFDILEESQQNDTHNIETSISGSYRICTII